MLAALALEDGGISLPASFLGRKFRLKIKTPTTRSMIRISKEYLKMNTTFEEYKQYSFQQKVRFMYIHSHEVSRMVAYGIIRGPILGRILNRPVAYILRNTMTPVEMGEAFMQILSLANTIPFGSIIRSAEAMNKMQPFLSHKDKS